MDRDAMAARALEYARERMQSVKPSHGWDHVERVMAFAERLALAEGADPFIVRLAAALHDIARAEEDASPGTLCHAEEGSREAYLFLRELGLDEGPSRHVADCVLTHRFRKARVPATVEAAVLHDADKLDAIGAIGVGRAFLFAGEVGAIVHNGDVDIRLTEDYSEEDTAYREYSVKLKHLKERMLTAEGRRLAEGRHDFMVEFFERLDREHRGEA
ncbi:MAG: putative hydrolase [Spirochaetes bacterium ADurb.BinA120]|nr:MAG: putative hydrolase [Spirochaetes bacterium ADurb.BinA120]